MSKMLQLYFYILLGFVFFRFLFLGLQALEAVGGRDDGLV